MPVQQLSRTNTFLRYVNYTARVIARIAIIALTLPTFLLISVPISLTAYIIDSINERNKEQTLSQRLYETILNTLNAQVNTIETAENLIDKYHGINTQYDAETAEQGVKVAKQDAEAAQQAAQIRERNANKQEAMGILSSAFLTTFTVAATTFLGTKPLMIFTAGDMLSRNNHQKQARETADVASSLTDTTESQEFFKELKMIAKRTLRAPATQTDQVEVQRLAKAPELARA